MRGRMKSSFLPRTRVTFSDSVQQVLRQHHLDTAVCLELVKRHASGDWGEITPEQRTVNEAALQVGRGVVQGTYWASPLGEVWVLTGINQVRDVPPTTYVFLGTSAQWGQAHSETG